VPGADWLEREADAGVRGAGVTLVDREGQPERLGGEGEAALFPRFADDGMEDVFAFFHVARREA
jgi:hypothetical protein